jgi:ADP-ribose pyrophosphatase
MVAKGPREMVCQLCDYQHFLTPIPAACVLIVDAQNRLLITRRAHEPGLGKWGIPGGVIEPGETGEIASARELREEVGIEIAPEEFRYLCAGNNQYLFQDFVWPTLDLFFTVYLRGPAVEILHDPKEVAEALWCPLDEVPLDDFAFASNAEAVRVLRMGSPF